MPYLNLDLDYFTHPKVMRLVGIIGPQHVAIPIRLWCYTAKHHTESGLLQAYSKQEVESVVGWTGEPGVLVDALLKIGFIDEIKNGYAIHDWFDHAGHLAAFKKRAKTAAKKRWRSIATSIPKKKTTNAPILTNPNRTNPTIPTVPTGDGEDLEEKDKPRHATSFNQSIADRWNRINGVKICKKVEGKLAERLTKLSREKTSEWWDEFFEQVERSPFLTGRATPRPGEKPFRANLFWATGPENLSKVVSGNYDDDDGERRYDPLLQNALEFVQRGNA